MVKWKQWLGVKAGPWWCASVSVKVSEVGAAACDDGVASKATEEWSSGRCIPPIVMQDHPDSNIYHDVPTPHYSATTPQVWPKECMTPSTTRFNRMTPPSTRE